LEHLVDERVDETETQKTSVKGLSPIKKDLARHILPDACGDIFNIKENN